MTSAWAKGEYGSSSNLKRTSIALKKCHFLYPIASRIRTFFMANGGSSSCLHIVGNSQQTKSRCFAGKPTCYSRPHPFVFVSPSKTKQISPYDIAIHDI